MAVKIERKPHRLPCQSSVIASAYPDLYISLQIRTAFIPYIIYRHKCTVTGRDDSRNPVRFRPVISGFPYTYSLAPFPIRSFNAETQRLLQPGSFAYPHSHTIYFTIRVVQTIRDVQEDRTGRRIPHKIQRHRIIVLTVNGKRSYFLHVSIIGKPYPYTARNTFPCNSPYFGQYIPFLSVQKRDIRDRYRQRILR